MRKYVWRIIQNGVKTNQYFTQRASAEMYAKLCTGDVCVVRGWIQKGVCYMRK